MKSPESLTEARLRESVREIREDLQALEIIPGLFHAEHFRLRADALDRLEFHVLDRIEGLAQGRNPPEALLPLKNAAERLGDRLASLDQVLFQSLRARIREGCSGAAFKDLVEAHAGLEPENAGPDGFGYDRLDVFLNGLLHARSIPPESKEREPEMVFYQKTPARIVFELVETASLGVDDVFYDLGSGLGQVPILVNLLAGVAAKGVEIDPAYCGYARACAADLSLSRVEFLESDARMADYSDGTVFFLYTPFEGRMLEEALDRVREATSDRPVRLFTYGPCTAQVARRLWLERLDGGDDHPGRLGAFRSLCSL